MKLGGFALVGISFLQCVTSQPHGPHRHRHAKRDLVTNYVTVTQPEVVVWVNQNGQTVRIETKTSGVAAATSAPAELTSSQVVASATISVQSVPPDSAVQAYEVSSSTPASPSSPSSTSQTASSAVTPSISVPPTSSVSVATVAAVSDSAISQPSSGTEAKVGGNSLGITYSPYLANGQCKSQSQVNNDFKSMSSYSFVRIYGVDCNQVKMVISAAAAHSIKVFAGLVNLDNLAANLDSMKTQVNGKWGAIDTISIGNELVNTGTSPAAVIAALGTARGILGAAGYTGSIVTVDTFNQLIAHPELCANSDYCAANCHAFFNSDLEASGAGEYVAEQAKLVSEAANGKRTVITESGWPHAGEPNGQAVPSLDNQKAAIASLVDSFPADLFLFTAFDDLWKAHGQFNVEQSWGITN